MLATQIKLFRGKRIPSTAHMHHAIPRLHGVELRVQLTPAQARNCQNTASPATSANWGANPRRKIAAPLRLLYFYIVFLLPNLPLKMVLFDLHLHVRPAQKLHTCTAWEKRRQCSRDSSQNQLQPPVLALSYCCRLASTSGAVSHTALATQLQKEGAEHPAIRRRKVTGSRSPGVRVDPPPQPSPRTKPPQAPEPSPRTKPPPKSGGPKKWLGAGPCRSAAGGGRCRGRGGDASRPGGPGGWRLAAVKEWGGERWGKGGELM